MSGQAKKSDDAAELVDLVVAPGRSIDVPTGEKREVGTELFTGKAVTTGVTRKLLDGERLAVDRDEAKYLLRVGAAVLPEDYRPRPLPNSSPVGSGGPVQGPQY